MEQVIGQGRETWSPNGSSNDRRAEPLVEGRWATRESRCRVA